jgi:phage terminase small subunit|tara:strand:- start:521 stop:1183 length:663 start_codon:yes stop_codon:yes gene_type:complete
MPKRDVWNVPPVIPDKAKKRLSTEVKPLSKQKVMNAKEWKFVQEYVSGDGRVTLKEAAIRAGYTTASASVMAWKLTNPKEYPHVVAAIQAYRAELASKYNTSYERHMRDLQIIRDKAMDNGAWAAAVQAEYRRGQALGTIYVERKEIRHGTIDSMSKEEVQRKLEELKQLYGPPPTALIDAETGIVLDSVEREKDPAFDPGVAEPPLDIFERDNDDGPDA